MAPRPSREVPLPPWLSIERQYDDDHEATVQALVQLIEHPVTRRIAEAARAGLNGGLCRTGEDHEDRLGAANPTTRPESRAAGASRCRSRASSIENSKKPTTGA